MTTHENITRVRSTARARPRPGGRRLIAAAGLVSAALAGLASLWLWRPSWNALADGDAALLRVWVGTGPVTLLQLGLGLLGAVAAAIALTSTGADRTRPWPSWLVPVGLVIALGFLGLSGWSAIAAAGYFMALAVPAVVALIVGHLVRRGGRARWLALLGGAVLLGGGLLTGVLTAESVGVVPEILASTAEQVPTFLPPGLLIIGLGTWVAASLQVSQGARATEGLSGWVLLHRRSITIAAALGGLPYALTRLSWLTPWPLLGGDAAATDPATRLWGLLLSTGAWAGFVLTLGLISRWGEVFPRWMPWVAGRAVPVWFAAVPGGLVATILTASALPTLLTSVGGEGLGLTGALIFPFWAWGPLLGLAVWGYVLHRRDGDCPA